MRVSRGQAAKKKLSLLPKIATKNWKAGLRCEDTPPALDGNLRRRGQSMLGNGGDHFSSLNAEAGQFLPHQHVLLAESVIQCVELGV